MALTVGPSRAMTIQPRPLPVPDPPPTPQELRRWRNEKLLTQQQLADLLGVAWLTVQRWEAGTRGVPSFLGLVLRRLDQLFEAVDRRDD